MNTETEQPSPTGKWARTKKALLCIAVVAMMLMVSLSICVQSESVAKVGDNIWYQGLNYKVTSDADPGEVMLDANRTENSSLTIPESIGHEGKLYLVTSIAESALAGCRELTSVTIPKYVETIGDKAFYRCSSLGKIIVDDNNPKYSSDTQGDQNQYRSLYNKDKTKLIQCSSTIASFVVPVSVTEIDPYAFSSNFNLYQIKVAEGNTKYSHVGYESNYYALYDYNKTTLVRCPIAFGISDFTIPNTVVTIAENALFRCDSIRNLSFETGSQVTTIGDRAFASTVFGSLTFPNTVTSIGEYVLSGACAYSVTLPDQLEEIGDYCFANSFIMNPVIPDSVIKIGAGAFKNCYDLGNVIIGNNVSSIDDSAFQGSGLTSITLGSSIKYISGSALRGCVYLQSINVVPENQTYSSHDGVLYDRDMTSLIQCPGAKRGEYAIPDGVEKIEEYAFSSTSLSSVIMPDSVVSIGFGCFEKSSSLTTVKLSKNLISIGDSAFYGCNSLNNIELPQGLLLIGDLAFHECDSFTSVVIPDSVTHIGSGAFEFCHGLTSVTLPEGLTTIESGTFGHCTGLISIEIPDSVTYIDHEAFCVCVNLTEIILPEGITEIGDEAFYRCESLKDVVVKNEEPPILGANVFKNCDVLTAIIVPSVSGEKYTQQWGPKLPSGVSVSATIVNIPDPNDLVYNGKEQIGVDFMPDIYTITGNTATNAGTYKATITLKEGLNLRWSDDYTAGSREVEWSIGKKVVTVSGITANSKVYDGNTNAVLNYSNVVINGAAAGDDLSVVAIGTFVNDEVGNNKVVNITGITLRGDSASNYVLAEEGQQTTTTANITQSSTGSDNSALIVIGAVIGLAAVLGLLYYVVRRY